ncbi:hypothetical protein HMPREF1550_01502 [Actinomyces sp. oral taxon 877 str. F0543]|nr:hypothetical protein HMPREF1550_01502 [Actinomyces sp. oral taxon 877 str. F0543]
MRVPGGSPASPNGATTGRGPCARTRGSRPGEAVLLTLAGRQRRESSTRTRGPRRSSVHRWNRSWSLRRRVLSKTLMSAIGLVVMWAPSYKDVEKGDPLWH